MTIVYIPRGVHSEYNFSRVTLRKWTCCRRDWLSRGFNNWLKNEETERVHMQRRIEESRCLLWWICRCCDYELYETSFFSNKQWVGRFLKKLWPVKFESRFSFPAEEKISMRSCTYTQRVWGWKDTRRPIRFRAHYSLYTYTQVGRAAVGYWNMHDVSAITHLFVFGLLPPGAVCESRLLQPI